MRNVKPKKLSELLTSSQDLAAGAGQIGDAIGIKQNTQAAILADIAGLTTPREAYEAGKATLDQRRQVVDNINQDARRALTLAREILKLSLGSEPSPAWNVTGFVGSFGVPAVPSDVQDRVFQMNAYLTANPTKENASLNITAARFGALFNDLSAARAAVHSQEMTVGDLLATRNAAADALGLRWRSTVNELALLLTPLDPRWSAFGLNRPGASAIADVPENITAVLIGNTAVAVRWAPAPRAEYYRVWKKVNGVDEHLVVVGSPADLDFTLEGLPANSTIELAVSAVNNGGESMKSQVITIVTH